MIIYQVTLFIVFYTWISILNGICIELMNGFEYLVCVHAEIVFSWFQDERGSMAESWLDVNISNFLASIEQWPCASICIV